MIILCFSGIVTAVIDMLSQKGSFINPANSCREIPSASQPGEYWITDNDNQTPTRVYCNTSKSCGDSAREWTRVAYIDMTDPNQQCPEGLTFVSRTEAPLRLCGQAVPRACVSTTFPVNGKQYTHVYGRIKAYQDETPDAFVAFYHNQALTIDDNYVDGISLTHGQSPRQHIWTFAGALDEVANSHAGARCPCTRPDVPFPGIIPPFIGQDYFCDTASRDAFQHVFYSGDPLWDGQGCGGTSTCCSFNNPPWFCKQLPQPTTDDIELRLCSDQGSDDESIPMELIEIYIQ